MRNASSCFKPQSLWLASHRLAGLLLAGLLFATLAARAAEVNINLLARSIVTPEYVTVVAPDGCLTNLNGNEGDFLAPNVQGSRGTYFYQENAVLQLPDVTVTSTNTLTAKGDKAEIRYEFALRQMTWTLTNKTDKPMNFFMIFDPAVKVGGNGQGEYALTPAAKDWTNTVWFLGTKRLTIAGGSKIWGPWAGGYQVWEASLAPKETRPIHLTLEPATDAEKAKVNELKMAQVKPESDLTVLAPLNWQVFQRQTRLEGAVLVSGRVKPDCDKIQVRLSGKPLAGGWRKFTNGMRLLHPGVERDEPGHWHTIPVDRAGRSFAERIPTLAGGWYQADIRALRHGKVVAQATVEHVGVGEVFVGAGQSNSTNCGGEGQLKPQTGMVSTFSGSEWRPADDPQPGVHDHSTGGSFWPAFGDAMVRKYQVPVGLAVTGHGGTSINQWQKDGELFNWMLTRINQLGPQGFRALLWHQGETDVAMTSAEYKQGLTTIIHDSQAAAGWPFPWVVARVSYHTPDQPLFESTRTAQTQMWAEGVALEGPDTDTLTGDNRDVGGKGIHFSPKGLKAHGEMWAGKVGAWLDKALGK